MKTKKYNKTEIKKELIKYLEEKGVKDKYLKYLDAHAGTFKPENTNSLDYFIGAITGDDKLAIHMPEILIGGAFAFHLTDEGHAFWVKIKEGITKSFN